MDFDAAVRAVRCVGLVIVAGGHIPRDDPRREGVRDGGRQHHHHDCPCWLASLLSGDFLPQFFASTFENWQSEFLQLIWQAAGLALFYYWGSSQSRESDERIEAKLDALLRERNLDPENP